MVPIKRSTLVVSLYRAGIAHLRSPFRYRQYRLAVVGQALTARTRFGSKSEQSGLPLPSATLASLAWLLYAGSPSGIRSPPTLPPLERPRVVSMVADQALPTLWFLGRVRRTPRLVHIAQPRAS